MQYRLTNAGNAMRGFTMVELIAVLVIVGVLAAVAAPRFFTRSDFDARGFSDQTLAILRYAQKAAVAERRTVCVAFSAVGVAPATVTLTIGSAFGVACNTPLTGPDGTVPYRITAPGGIAFSSSPATPLTFSPLGQASPGQTIQVAGAPNTITVVQETGYVYVP